MLFQFCYSVPDGFTNLDVQPDGPTNGEEYLQTTLSTGKRLLFASYQESTYEQAEEICSSRGAEIVLPTEDENIQVRDFLRLGPRDKVAFVRVVNLGAPAYQNWVDPKDNSQLEWDGDHSNIGGNPGITEYSYDNALIGFIGNFQ